MLKLNSTIQRICWLVFVDLRYKYKYYGLMFLLCFAILMLYYWNPTFQFTKLIEHLLGQSTTNYFSSTSYEVNGIRYFQAIGPNEPDLKHHINYFSFALLGLGLAINSSLFREYGDSKSKAFNISLPATSTEKWLSKVILSLIVYPLVFLTLYQVYAILTYHWGNLRGFEFVRLHIYDPWILQNLIKYFSIASIFIGLSSVFRVRSLIKMVLFMVLGYFVFSFILNVIALIVTPDFDYSQMKEYFLIEAYHDYVYSNHHQFDKGYRRISDIILKTSFIELLAVTSLVFSYFKIYELEAQA